MKARIAGAPISWGMCEVPEWGHQLDAERVLDEMAELGLGAAEFGPPGFLPADPEEAIRPDFVAHFADAYRVQMASWVQQAARGLVTGPSAWDGFVATLVAEAGVASLIEGRAHDVTVPEQPPLYLPALVTT